MTSEQIAELREILPPIARGDSVQIHRESYERAKGLTLKLLDEREALLGAAKYLVENYPERQATRYMIALKRAIAKAESP